MDQELFNLLSAFYIDIWRYLNSFYDDSRWLQVYESEEIERSSRLDNLQREYQDIINHNLYDTPLGNQVNLDYNRIEQLSRDFSEFSTEQPLGEDWLARAETMRAYAQDLGLRYAEIAVNGE